MKHIQQIAFDKAVEPELEFEIIDLEDFFAHRIQAHSIEHHRANFFIMFVVSSGFGVHEIDFQQYAFGRGDVMLVNCNQVHRFVSFDNVCGQMLVFTDHFVHSYAGQDAYQLQNIFRVSGNLPLLKIQDNFVTDFYQALHLLQSEFERQLDSQKPQIIKSLLRILIALIDRSRAVTRPVLARGALKRFMEFRDLLELHIGEKNTVAEYADAMFVSEKSINEATKSVTQLSAKQFIIERIVLEIKRYLAQNEKTLTEISNILGFDEPTNMTKFFKKHAGLTPSEFQKALKP